MFKLNRWVVSFSLISFVLLFVYCKKDVVNEIITSNDGAEARLMYTEKGYTEIEVNPI
jgi:hypothetical protein